MFLVGTDVNNAITTLTHPCCCTFLVKAINPQRLSRLSQTLKWFCRSRSHHGKYVMCFVLHITQKKYEIGGWVLCAYIANTQGCSLGQILMDSVSVEASTVTRLTAIWMVGVHSNCWTKKEELKRWVGKYTLLLHFIPMYMQLPNAKYLGTIVDPINLGVSLHDDSGKQRQWTCTFYKGSQFVYVNSHKLYILPWNWTVGHGNQFQLH